MSEPITHADLQETWAIIARLRRARGDREGAARARRNAACLRLSTATENLVLALEELPSSNADAAKRWARRGRGTLTYSETLARLKEYERLLANPPQVRLSGPGIPYVPMTAQEHEGLRAYAAANREAKVLRRVVDRIERRRDTLSRVNLSK